MNTVQYIAWLTIGVDERKWSSEKNCVCTAAYKPDRLPVITLPRTNGPWSVRKKSEETGELMMERIFSARWSGSPAQNQSAPFGTEPLHADEAFLWDMPSTWNVLKVAGEEQLCPLCRHS
ncbi:hypothetical protein AVEN_190244-1 [Araneus ventricosus]|uniref:Uncharacterized protein n=1 Tax=Araneus ventricosus TaxID=182803 RepID=A0A4Y2M1P9_ARAVE|nr:hypothetical protein AVEN_190244-1 [Araneus ventricosus]